MMTDQTGTSEGIFEENLVATGMIGRDAIGATLSCRQSVSEESSA